MVTILPPQQLSRTTWKLNWSSDAAPPIRFRVYRDGQFFVRTAATFLIVTIPGTSSPLFEIFDDETSEPTVVYPGTVVLQWYRSVGAIKYRVERLIEADPDVYETVATVIDDGSGYYRWESDRLPDDDNTAWRIVPVSVEGNDGIPVALRGRIVKFPEPPRVTFQYDEATRKITITPY